jgi:hypothetical protein
MDSIPLEVFLDEGLATSSWGAKDEVQHKRPPHPDGKSLAFWIL